MENVLKPLFARVQGDDTINRDGRFKASPKSPEQQG
jgi:hypothetical protein